MNIVTSKEHEGRMYQIQKGIQFNNCKTIEVQENKLGILNLLKKCHDSEYISLLHTKSKQLSENETFIDKEYAEPGVTPDTPIVKNIYQTACSSFHTAVQAAKYLDFNTNSCSYAVCRPPGHHAGPSWMGGYCYFNNAVGAVLTLKEKGFNRVGLIDLDFHFGNGSAAILKDLSDIFFGSIHGCTLENFPYKETYPEGEHQVFIPFKKQPTEEEYISSLTGLLKRAKNFGCKALVISVGYDLIEGDPHGKWSFSPEIFNKIGSCLSKVQMSLCLVQEGGYHSENLGICASNLIKGITE